MAEFSDLIGKTLVEVRGMDESSDAVTFITDDGLEYRMYHSQDCCESVYIEEVVGDAKNLLNTPILKASEDSNSNETAYGDEEWTFYNIATVKGYVTIRWYGESNGYYSTSVSFGLEGENGRYYN